ncbi:hypothetical protein V491_03711 [Pseudogymnoascus sp. VKM F-3775]|nr:hypothetical protein V491_03711 [Pseudogymnoascus sp. VKM F-3775]
MVRHYNDSLAPIVFLHGFGSTKEDYADIAHHTTFIGRPFVAYDMPGCGETFCHDLSQISISFLVNTARAILRELGIKRFHLVGHSMGGLVALILAHQAQDQVLSFINIKGNVAPEDCFLSRQIFTHPSDDPEAILTTLLGSKHESIRDIDISVLVRDEDKGDPEGFFSAFIERTRRSPFYASPLYASSLRSKVRVGAVRGIFESMVNLSDHGDLMFKFISLPCPRLFMYGEQNASLTYLNYLDVNGVELAEIPQSGHFPMYSNPAEMWMRISNFIKRSELLVGEVAI